MAAVHQVVTEEAAVTLFKGQREVGGWGTGESSRLCNDHRATDHSCTIDVKSDCFNCMSKIKCRS